MSSRGLPQVYGLVSKNSLPICFNMKKTQQDNNMFDALGGGSMVAMVLIEMPDEEIPTDAVEGELQIQEWSDEGL